MIFDGAIEFYRANENGLKTGNIPLSKTSYLAFFSVTVLEKSGTAARQ